MVLEVKARFFNDEIHCFVAWHFRSAPNCEMSWLKNLIYFCTFSKYQYSKLVWLINECIVSFFSTRKVVHLFHLPIWRKVEINANAIVVRGNYQNDQNGSADGRWMGGGGCINADSEGSDVHCTLYTISVST
jgi:hypothetical protein